ncbi:hypothetical protein P4H08_18865 [Bacillus cereus]|nr:hypothetical protein [Bacillus cereus]
MFGKEILYESMKNMYYEYINLKNIKKAPHNVTLSDQARPPSNLKMQVNVVGSNINY